MRYADLDITLSDREGRGERSPSRLIAACRCCNAIVNAVQNWEFGGWQAQTAAGFS